MPQTTHAKPVAPRLRSAAPPVTTVHATATSPAVGALTRGRVINTLSPRQCSFSSSFSSFSGAASRQPNFCSVFRHDSNISSVSSQDPDTGDSPAQGSTPRVESLAGAVSPDWLSSSMSHAEIVSTAAAHVPSQLRSRRVERALHTISHSPATPQGGFIPWPRRSSDPPSPPPPSITPELVRAVEQQDQHSDPDAPYPPALAGFVADLERWHRRLLQHFGMSQSSYASNTRAAASRIRSRISFLPRERVTRVMRVVTEGYTIPFVSVPPPFHRQHNSPDLRQHRDQAWAALHKDMSHGAVVPCDIPSQGLPDVVSPVRTAPKGWRTGKRRFVINMRYLNSFIPEGESSCDMENLQSIRNMLTFQGYTPSWFVSMDLASGYHNFLIHESQWQLMGFALHHSELPPDAVASLHQNFPGSFHAPSGNFYFIMRALPFGLAPSCAVFSDVVTALAAAWRRHKICGAPLRLSSYIDDYLGVLRCALSSQLHVPVRLSLTHSPCTSTGLQGVG